MRYYSVGALIVDWVYGKQIEGKLKWLPSVGETSGFAWIVGIDITVFVSFVSFVAFVIWAL